MRPIAWWLLCARCMTGFGSLGTLRVTSGRVSAQSLFGLLRATTAAHSSGSRCPSLACPLSIAALPRSVLFRLHGTSLCSVPPYPLSLSLSAELRLAIHKTKQNKTKNTLTFIHECTLKQNKETKKKSPNQTHPAPKILECILKTHDRQISTFCPPQPLFFIFIFF